MTPEQESRELEARLRRTAREMGISLPATGSAAQALAELEETPDIDEDIMRAVARILNAATRTLSDPTP
jgi:hypothetical protein